jgi:spore coat polysaccharide biosynthesis protein SpsF (cytidylyltransferase family)
MTPPPLAIVTARMRSSRLPGKVLADCAGRPLIAWATDAAIAAFGRANVVIATTADPENAPIVAWAKAAGVQCFAWDGPEADVLGRFAACAETYRWHPESIVVRVTPDDPRKRPDALRRVAEGVREPVELGGEAITLDALRRIERSLVSEREHLTYAFFGYPAPLAPDGLWTVDTPEQLAAMDRLLTITTAEMPDFTKDTPTEAA